MTACPKCGSQTFFLDGRALCGDIECDTYAPSWGDYFAETIAAIFLVLAVLFITKLLVG